MGAQRALGRLFDIGCGFAPVDLNTAGATGKRFSLSGATGITFVFAVAVAGGGTDDNVITFKQHTAYTGGTSNNLAAATVTTSSGITAYWLKAETALDNDEAWVEVTQADGATITLSGATYASQQVIVAVYVSADQLGDGYTHVSADFADPGSGGSRLGVCLGIVHDLAVQRKPANLPNLLRPGAANA
jgi:hypothetical protein